MKKYNHPVRLPIHAAENVTKYLKAVRKKFGVDEYQMFSTVDLSEGKNIYQVASHLHALGRTIQKKVEDEGFPWKPEWPHLGIKETKKNVRTFTEEQLRRAAAQPSILNMGSSRTGRKQAEDVLTGEAGRDLPREKATITKVGGGAGKAAGGSKASAGAAEDPKAAAKAAWKAKMAAKKAGAAAPAPAAATSSVPAGWEELYTDDGTVYYYNSSTGETQWEMPSGGGGGGGGVPAGWEELYTDDGTVYYYNSSTGETQWEAPSG